MFTILSHSNEVSNCFEFGFFSNKFTKLKSDLQATLGSLGQLLLTNINFSKLVVC